MSHGRQELIHECLVDGPRSRDAQDIERGEFAEIGEAVTVALQLAGWERWAKTLTDHQPGMESVERLGQALEVLRRFGPLPRDGDGKKALNVLVASSGPYWNSQSTDD